MSNLLGNKKVYVGKLSREIQEKAFRLGWVWSSSNKGFGCKTDKEHIKYLHEPFLYFNSNNTIERGNKLDYFNIHSYQEVTPEWILNLPEKPDKSWERLGSKITGFHVLEEEIAPVNIVTTNFSEEPKEFDVYNILPSKEEAEAYRILPKLLYWRDFYNEGWKPDWKSRDQWKYCIYSYENKITDAEYLNAKYIFAFKSKEIMNKFLEDFREELEIVKPLL